MNPHSNEQAGLNLPSPIEQGGAADVDKTRPESSTQPMPSIAENTPLSAAQKAPALAIPLPPIPTQNDISTTKTGGISDVPSTADDNDLIEKEWVEKAKKIVESTREDPYMQSKKLTEFKAEYMQKRYSKTIKVQE